MSKNLLSINKEKMKAGAFTLLITAVYVVYLLWVVGVNYGGNINWLPVGSDFFGIPDKVQKAFNVDLLIKNGDCGWDGQFYYYMSNDLFGLNGYAQFVDNPPYRWQRIGLPLAAKLVSLVHLGKAVSVYDYLIANLIIIALGIYVFSKFLCEKNRSVLWVVPWCLSGGVLITMKSLLPDSAADALVVIATIMLLKRRYLWYVVAMSWACLTREGYAAIAFFVFLAGFFGYLENEKKYSIKFATLLATPGIVFVLWYLYVTIRFGALPFTTVTHITKFFMTEWPAVFIDAVQKRNYEEFVGLTFYILTIAISAILAYIAGRKDRRYLVFLPYIFIVGSFGYTVMKHWSGYLKGVTFLFALIPILFFELDVVKKRKKSDVTSLLQIGIGGYIVLGILLTLYLVPKHAANMAQTYYLRMDESAPVDYSNSNPLQDFGGEINIENVQIKPFASNSFIAALTPEYAVYTVRVKNNTDTMWSKYQPYGGKYAINMGYKWYTIDDENTVILEGRTNLENSVEPYSVEEEKLYVKYPLKKGKYVLKISMVQEGVAWFMNQNGAETELMIDIK